jgi:D-tyrosyl-tRNA(Tyr) deacylase
VRAVVQRVDRASVAVEAERLAEIGPGLLVLLGVARGDGEGQADQMIRKLLALRIFEDGDGRMNLSVGDAGGQILCISVGDGRMNLSVGDAGGQILCISQFTLLADTRKGNRPSFVEAAPAEDAEALYERVRDGLGAQGGRFGARMEVELTNDGPVTVIVDV